MMFGKDPDRANERSDRSEETTLRLSDDIGKMADRIGDMADRIGEMADRIGEMSERILETQRIQGQNLELMQESVAEALQMMSRQMEANTRLVELVLKTGAGEKPIDLGQYRGA